MRFANVSTQIDGTDKIIKTKPTSYEMQPFKYKI